MNPLTATIFTGVVTIGMAALASFATGLGSQGFIAIVATATMFHVIYNGLNQ